jgi:hypothetical protein
MIVVSWDPTRPLRAAEGTGSTAASQIGRKPME